MTKPPSRPGSTPRVRIRTASSDERVGYGRPPQAHQFKPGQSGNPKGRPKGLKNEATILHELLHRKIPIREGGQTRKIMVLEAILLRFTEDSLKGNTKSAAFLLNRHNLATTGQPQQVDIGDDDRQILDEFMNRVMAQNALKKDPS